MSATKPITASILEKTGAIRIILYIYRNIDRPEGVYLTELIRNIPIASDTTMLTVKGLIANSIIKDERLDDRYKKRVFKLTESGLEVAKYLAAVDEVLRLKVLQEHKSNR